jgi:hypothetical protein
MAKINGVTARATIAAKALQISKGRIRWTRQ